MVSRHHAALLGVYKDTPLALGGVDVICPVCTVRSADAWQRVGFQQGQGYGPVVAPAKTSPGMVSLEWMYCAEETCGQLIVRLTEQTFVGPGIEAQSWVVRPRLGGTRTVDPLVTGRLRKDYEEAAAILDLSPRMSAVMSRRILADLLEQYAGLKDFSLEKRIDAFTGDTSRPSQLRENLHHFREAANFGAHTQQDDQAEVIDVGPDEAEWTLDLIERLFDHFIVSPAKDKAMREAMDARIAAAGRKPIAPPPETT